jgi:AAA family ATP:ADP antiporter
MLEPITLSITVAGILAMIIFYFINNYILKTNIINDKCIAVNGDTKTRLSLLDSIKLIINSKYIGHIVLMVLCYGLTINLLEGPWKAKIKEYYPNTLEYVNFMGSLIYIWVSLVSYLLLLVAIFYAG